MPASDDATVTGGDIAAAKAALRVSMLAERNALAPETRARAGLRIQQQIIAHPAFERARVVMAYCSFGSELDTSLLLAEAFARGKTLVLPRVDRQRQALALFAVRDLQHELVADRWGIREPRPEACPYVSPAALELVIAPGIAFDAVGGRLGYGKGYYDKLLHASKLDGGTPFTIAGAFEAQMVDRVPIETHDVAVLHIATEARLIDCTAHGSDEQRTKQIPLNYRDR